MRDENDYLPAEPTIPWGVLAPLETMKVGAVIWCVDAQRERRRAYYLMKKSKGALKFDTEMVMAEDGNYELRVERVRQTERELARETAAIWKEVLAQGRRNR